MENPYEILQIKQDADKASIMKAQFQAMREKKYSLQDIHIAVRRLLDPTKRLATDYMFPVKIKSKRIQVIAIDTDAKEIDLSTIDKNAFDSL